MRIAKKLYRDGVQDERKAAFFYRRMSKELRDSGLHSEADALVVMAESEEVHKDILNEIIADIKEKVILSQFQIEVTYKGKKGSLLMRRR